MFYLLGLFSLTFLQTMAASHGAQDSDAENVVLQEKPSHYRSPAQVIGHRSLEIETGLKQFTSQSRADDLGNSATLQKPQAFSQRDYELEVRYGPLSKMELKGGVRYRDNQAVGLFKNDLDQDISQKKQAAGVESMVMGIKYQLLGEWKLKLAVAGDFRVSNYSHDSFNLRPAPRNIELAEDKLVLGDGGSETRLGVLLTSFWNTNPQLSASLFWARPPAEQSQELLYGVEWAYSIKELTLLAGLDGTHSLKTDPYGENRIGLKQKPEIATNGTHLYNSINRSFVDFYLGFQYQLTTQYKISGKYGRRELGTSTDEGYFYGLSLTMQFPGINPDPHAEVKVNQFKEYQIEANVVKVSPRAAFVKIDKGVRSDVEDGMKMDLFQFDYLGKNVLVATGYVFEAGSDSAFVKVERFYKNLPIKIGFVARGNSHVNFVDQE